MNPHQFTVIKVLKGTKSKYFTGAFRKRHFQRVCKWLGLPEIYPILSDNERDAEFHLSPSESYEHLQFLRTKCPEYNWFCDTAILQDYTNEAMQKNFIVIVRRKSAKQWRYYIAGAYDTNGELSVTESMYQATPMTIDDIKVTCQALHINHKDYNYQAIPFPNERNVHADDIEEYLKNNPPKSMFMTFKVKK